MFDFTKQDLANYYQFVVINVAQKLGIKNAEWKSMAELDIEISNSSLETYKLLEQFIQAYQGWYDYSFDENGKGKSFEAANESGSGYFEVSKARDVTRENLLQKINAKPTSQA